MGRIGRQRKYKRVDPSCGANRAHETDSHHDLAPKGKLEDQSIMPRKMKKMISVSRVAAGKIQDLKRNGRNHRKEARKSQNNDNLKIKPGETRKQFFSRLDNQVDVALNTALMGTKKVRESRKSHLKKRDEKVKSKKLKPSSFANEKSNQIHCQGLEAKNYTDIVKFGEVVNEPPQISMIPRKAKFKKVSSSNMKLASVMLEGNHENNINDQSNKGVATKKVTYSKDELDEERIKIIAEYRKMKHRKNHSRFVAPAIS